MVHEKVNLTEETYNIRLPAFVLGLRKRELRLDLGEGYQNNRNTICTALTDTNKRPVIFSSL